MTPRIAVVGTGTIGVMTLWRLAARGVRATGFDLFAPGHDSGAAGGDTRAFRLAYREGPQYVPLLREARTLWRELETMSGATLLHQVGVLTVGRPDAPALEAIEATARTCGLALHRLDPAAVADRFPEHVLRDDEIGLLDPAGGFLAAGRSLDAAAVEAERLGATIHRYAPVVALEPTADAVLVRTAEQTLPFDKVVLCAGPWAQRFGLVDEPSLLLRSITSLWFPVRTPGRFDPRSAPVVMRASAPTFSCFPPSISGAVKLNLHGRDGQVTVAADAFTELATPDRLPRLAAPDLLDRASAAVRAVLPDLSPHPIRVGTYPELFTADGHPVIGPVPGDTRIILALGFSGHGFKMSPTFGEILSDLALTGRSTRPIDFLSPGRGTSGVP